MFLAKLFVFTAGSIAIGLAITIANDRPDLWIVNGVLMLTGLALCTVAWLRWPD